MSTHHHRLRGVSKTQTSKRKRKDELRDLNSLRSRAKAVFVFVTRLCFLGLCLQGLRFRGLRFRAFARERIMAAMNLNPLVRLFFFFCYLLFFSPCKQTPRKHRRVTNTKTAFARERNEVKSLSSSFLFLFEVCVFETPSAAD